MRLAAISLTAFCALVFLPSAAATAKPNVRGVVVRPPAGSGCYPDEPCDPPAVASMLVFTRGGRTVGRILVGASGQFALRLAPGIYGVRAAPASLDGDVTPASFRVPRSGTVHLRLQVLRSTIPAPG